MTGLYQLSLVVAAALSALVSASTPFLDAEVRAFLESDPIVKRSIPVPANKPLARRAAEGYRTRHLRPVYETTKRDEPDLGGEVEFGDGTPQPIRGSSGETFLSGSNEEIDRQNPDSLAPPPTDNGELLNEGLLAYELMTCNLQASYRTSNGASRSATRAS
jgi:hypothetical protein